MKKRNSIVVFSMILTLICCCLTGFAAAVDGPPVTMEVSSVYGEAGKLGVHIPISVKLYGQSTAPFEGTLIFQTLENAAEEGEEVYEYQYPVTIGTGETIEKKVYIPLGQRSNEIHVILLDYDGKEVGAETMYFDISKDVGRLLIGALTDKKEEIAYLDNVSLDYGMVQTKLLYLDEAAFSEDAKGLEMLDILVINHYDSSALSERQITALMDWVNAGGTLLIGTGAMANRTLGPLAEDLVELPTLTVHNEKVNLGVEYEEKAPGDSDVSMVYADLEIPGGRVVAESDGMPLLTIVSLGKGSIGIYNYDLSELTAFVDKNPNYLAKMLTDILGENEISNLYYYSSYGSETDYWNAYSLVNTGSADRLPNLTAYTIVIMVYICLVGPGLYLFLKKKDMSRLYSTSVLITSIVAAAVVYLLGIGTRFTSQFFTVASVMELEGETVKEVSYMNVRTPDSRPFSATIPTEYSVTPLTRSNRYGEQPMNDFEKNEKSLVELIFSENGTILSARQSSAFEPRFYKLTNESKLDASGGIHGEVEWSDGMFSGTLVNDYPFTLEDAALMFYGQIYLIGDMEAGEVRKYEQEPLLVWPVNMSYMAAGQITGSDRITDKSDREYLLSSEKNGLVSYYVGERFGQGESGAYVIGIGPNGGILATEQFARQSANGLTLYSAKIDVSTGQEDLIYRSGLTHLPEVNAVGGAIYGDGLTMYGTEPLSVEYFLGEDVSVEQVSFLPVSDLFFENPNYYYVKGFEGDVHFYNQMTKTYDGVRLEQMYFSQEELRPYLSPENSLIVKYSVDESDSAGVSWLLPHLMVTGRER